MRLLTISFFLLTSIGFANASSLRAKLPVLETLVPGRATQKMTLESFGKPTRALDVTKLRGTADSGVLWEYFEDDGVRLSISFEPAGELLSGWSWSVDDGDPEADPKVALSLFRNAKWAAEMPKWANPHQVPMECFFSDETKGVTLTYSRAKKHVTSISRWNPARKISSEENEKPPRFCIEGHCSDAKLSIEVFKDHPLCELPK